jgi:hypothetical protein
MPHLEAGGRDVSPCQVARDLARDPLEGGRNQIAIVVTIPNVYLSSQ